MTWRSIFSGVFLALGLLAPSPEAQTTLNTANPVCGMTNDSTNHVPSPSTWLKFTPPAVGGTYGSTNDDAVFGCTVTRLTNAAIDGLGAGEVQYYSTDSVISAQDTYVFIFDQNGNWHIVASGAKIGNATYVGRAGQVVVKVVNFPAHNPHTEPVWDMTQDNAFWITSNSNILYECFINGTNLTTCRANRTFTEYPYFLSQINMANMTPGGWLSMAGQATKGGSFDLFLYKPSTDTKSPVYTPASCNVDLETTVQPNCIHGVTPFIGETMLIDNSNITAPLSNVWWAPPFTSQKGTDSGDHGDLGYDLKGNIVGVYEDYLSSPGPWGACTHPYRPTIITYNSLGVPQGNPGCMFDNMPRENGFHVSYEDGTVRPWVTYSMQGSNSSCAGCTWGYFNSASGYTVPSSGNWITYANEIDMVRIDANNNSSKIYRLALTHTRAYDPSGGYWADPRANVSKDGNYIIFTSNSPYAASGCGSVARCTDVFMVSAAGQAPLFPGAELDTKARRFRALEVCVQPNSRSRVEEHPLPPARALRPRLRDEPNSIRNAAR